MGLAGLNTRRLLSSRLTGDMSNCGVGVVTDSSSASSAGLPLGGRGSVVGVYGLSPFSESLSPYSCSSTLPKDLLTTMECSRSSRLGFCSASLG